MLGEGASGALLKPRETRGRPNGDQIIVSPSPHQLTYTTSEDFQWIFFSTRKKAKPQSFFWRSKMTGNFDIFDAYSGRRGNLGLIPGYILALTKADLLGEYGPYPPRRPCVRRTKYVFSVSTDPVEALEDERRGFLLVSILGGTLYDTIY